MQNVLFAGTVAAQAALLSGAPPAGGLWELHNAVFSINGVSLATALIGFSVVGLRTRALRAWHGGLGLVSAAVLLAGAVLTPVTLGGGLAAFAYVDLPGFLLWLVWVVTFGVVLVRDRVPEPRSDAVGAAPAW
ncbi:hypothetical protein [Pseudonocardia sp. GCM10023141]|uniref:hypothetical protein n=1 Tax=Pseudonocardia sp. GCM10023141 TaxID=3252653 RepID=UPI00361BB95E